MHHCFIDKGDRVSQSQGPDDRAVVAAAIRGNTEALRDLWEGNRRWVAGVILAHKPRQTDLEDILQDVAAMYVKGVCKLRDESALRPWLRTIAINASRGAARDLNRRQRKIPFAPAADPDADPKPGHIQAVHDKDDASRILGLAEQLPDAYREPLILRCVRGMSYRQISQIVGLPETTVETRIARGRRMLREMINSDGSGPARRRNTTTDSKTGGTMQ